jgi:hypothetical protein
MKYRKSIHKLRKNKKISKRIKNKKIRKSRKKNRQSGGFIGTMFNAALAPVKMLSKPVINKLSSLMSKSKSNSSNNDNHINNSGGSGGLNNIDGGTLNSIRMNNSHISTIKQLSSYGYDNRTLSSYISQLQHINL